MTIKVALLGNRISNPGGGEFTLLNVYSELEESKKFEPELIFNDKKDNKKYKVFNTFLQSIQDFLPYELAQTISYLIPRFNKGLWEYVDEFEPDIILAQTQSAYFSIAYSSQRDTPVLSFLHAREYIYDGYHRGKNLLAKIANFFASRVNKELCYSIVSESDMLLPNSEHTREVYIDYFIEDIGDKMEVVYPVVDRDDYEVNETGEKILHVNPRERKGIYITLEVAEMMKDHDFIVVGTEGSEDIMERLESLDNIDYLGFIKDMKEVYKQTKIVLMPSKGEEHFGRIPIEAGFSGIPTVVSSKGGLPESSSSDDLVVDSMEAKDFVEKVQEIEENYNHYSSRARKKSLSKMETHKEKLFEIIEDFGENDR